MNEWKITAVIKRPPTLHVDGGLRIYNFTAVHTPAMFDDNGRVVSQGVPLWINCAWIDPPDQEIDKLTEHSLQKLEGAAFHRRFKRTGDQTYGYSMGMYVEKTTKLQQFGSNESTDTQSPPPPLPPLPLPPLRPLRPRRPRKDD